MKKFNIKVNGSQYEVEVEEVRDGKVVQSAAPVATTSAPAAVAAPVAAAPVVSASAPAGAEKITAPMPGTILGIKVKVGDQVKKGQPILVLEAMKMENEIPATVDGTIASINVQSGNAVNAGDVLASIG